MLHILHGDCVCGDDISCENFPLLGFEDRASQSSKYLKKYKFLKHYQNQTRHINSFSNITNLMQVV